MKTQVAIVGAGPAGLLLGHSLRAAGVECIVVERVSADHILGRIRAGVLERTTTDLLRQLGLADRLDREGIREEGFAFAHGERLVRIDIAKLTGTFTTVYGQTEITRDLMDAAPQRGLEIIYKAGDVALHDYDGDAPFLTFRKDGTPQRIDCRFIAGCDGFHGVSRGAMPSRPDQAFERIYPFGWLGILADVPPCHHDIVYANHPRGFALASKRSATRSRYYIDVPLDERLEDWSDDRLWDELAIRLGPDLAARITRGPALEKSIAPLRAFICETMRHGSLFLAGDAAHIVPPTGAKGLNLAASDVIYLSRGLIGYFTRADNDGLGAYAATALARVWNASRFSASLTRLLHHFPEDTAFDRRMQIAELDFIASNTAAQKAIAENYVGLPL